MTSIRPLLTRERSAGDAFAAEVTLPAGSGPPVMHRHRSFELYQVRTGELAFYTGAEDGSVVRETAGAGEVVAIPGDAEHTIRNESADEASAFVVFVPGDDMEPFAEALDAMGDHTVEEVSALAEAHGIEMTRPIPDGVRS